MKYDNLRNGTWANRKTALRYTGAKISAFVYDIF